MNTAQEPVIRIRDLHYAFGTGELRQEVLHGINLDVEPGKITFLMGPSGSGKTTLLKLMAGLRTVQQGSLVVDGVALESAKPMELVYARRKIGFIFQNHHLISSLNITQNVMMPLTFIPGLMAAEAKARAEQILREVGLGDHLHKKPEHLSGGQQQRVAIARALVHEPRLVLADEPTASLDGATGREVIGHLQRLCKERSGTVVLVTHDDRITDIADNIVELVDGHLHPQA